MSFPSAIGEVAAVIAQKVGRSSVGRIITGTEAGLQGAFDGIQAHAAAAAVEMVGYYVVQSPGVNPGTDVTESQVTLCHNDVGDTRSKSYERDLLTSAVGLSECIAARMYPDPAEGGKMWDSGEVHLRVCVPMKEEVPAHVSWIYTRHGQWQPKTETVEVPESKVPSPVESVAPEQSPEMYELADQVHRAKELSRAQMLASLMHYLHNVGLTPRMGPTNFDPLLTQNPDAETTMLWGTGRLFPGLNTCGETRDGATASYTGWIRYAHPENFQGWQIDSRFLLKECEHLLMWNEFMWQRRFNRCMKAIAIDAEGVPSAPQLPQAPESLSSFLGDELDCADVAACGPGDMPPLERFVCTKVFGDADGQDTAAFYDPQDWCADDLDQALPTFGDFSASFEEPLRAEPQQPRAIRYEVTEVPPVWPTEEQEVFFVERANYLFGLLAAHAAQVDETPHDSTRCCPGGTVSAFKGAFAKTSGAIRSGCTAAKRLVCCIADPETEEASPVALPATRVKAPMGVIASVFTVAKQRALGVRSLLVVDLVLPMSCFSTITRLAAQPIGGEKVAPTFLVGRAQSAAEAACTDNGTSESHMVALRAGCQLVLCGALADITIKGTRHVTIMKVEKSQCYKMSEGDALLAKIDDTVDALTQAVIQRHGEIPLCVPLRDPPLGSPVFSPESGLTVVLKEEELELWKERRAQGLGGGAVMTGPNLTGTDYPLDTHSPVTNLGAMNRHFADVSVVVDGGVPVKGEPTRDYTFTSEKRKDVKRYPLFDQVRKCILMQDMKALRKCLKEGKVGIYVDGNGPGSQSYEAHMDALHVDGVEEHARKLAVLFAAFMMKGGEAGDRPRGVTVPGVLGLEAAHQARCAPIMQMMEECYKYSFNHSMIKGQNAEDKKVSFGEFLNNMPKDWCGLSFDKKANDACWSQEIWELVCDYHHEIVEALWSDWLEKGVFTTDDKDTMVKLKAEFFNLTFLPFAMFLLTGIAPTSFFNRLCATIEEGVIVLTIYGEEAFFAWLKAREAPKVSMREHWLSNWKYGVKTTPLHCPKASVAGINEGDDKTGGFRLVLAPGAPGRVLLLEYGYTVGEDGKITPSQLISMIVRVMHEHTGMCYEVARMPNQDGNTGKHAVLEFCSVFITINTKGVANPLAQMVPKPMKALGKAGWSTTQAVTYVRGTGDESRKILGVVQDKIYFAYSATKNYALGQVNSGSPGVGLVFAAIADMHHRELVKLVGFKAANETLTLYDRRSAEARGIEEASTSVERTISELRDATHEMLSAPFSEHDCYAAAIAWQVGLAPALQGVTLPAIIASLLGFHESCSNLTIEMSSFNNPSEVLRQLSFGALTKPFLTKVSFDYRKMAQRYLVEEVPAQEIIDNIKSKLAAITVVHGTPAKTGSPDSAQPNQKKDQGPKKGGAKGPKTPADLAASAAYKAAQSASGAAAAPAAASGGAPPAASGPDAEGFTPVKGRKSKAKGNASETKDAGKSGNKGSGKSASKGAAKGGGGVKWVNNGASRWVPKGGGKGDKGSGKGAGRGKGNNESQRAPTSKDGQGRQSKGGPR